MEHRHAAAETLRQQHELERQAAENEREAAEEARVAAETRRRAVSAEVHGTIATLTNLVDRMEVVEALRRDARKRTP
jgi:membrane protein involved in colicin uptake